MPLNINQSDQINAGGTILTPTTGDTVIPAYYSRQFFMIQNLGTNILYVKFGAGATTSSFHIALKAGSVSDDGTGGSISSSIVVFRGPISVAGTSPRLVVTEI